ncbi:MAG: nuclear transport factor 2 family protein [Balneolaceae bacterium]|nr:nuclear transport factor 2 family protein [Balneolaceae bacterium]
MKKGNSLLFCLLLMIVTFIPESPAHAQNGTPEADSVKQVVLQNLEAYNRHDVAAMLGHIAEPFLWYSILSDTMVVEEYSQARFRSEMEAYFSDYPDVKSELIGLQVFGRYVYFEERATWGDDGEHSQSSLGIYEVVDGKIRRVWYYQ